MLEGVEQAIVNQAMLIQHNAADIGFITTTYPELALVSAHIMAKIVEAGANLDRLKISFRIRRPDLQLLSLLTDTNFLDNVDQDGVAKLPIRASSPAPLALDVEFTARRQDITTKVYEVQAFDFWANLTTETPSLQHYGAPEYLIYNKTIHCVRGIGQPKGKWINALCQVNGYEDFSLATWSTLATSLDPWKSQVRSTVKESWPYVYIYCYPRSIYHLGEESECPPYVFRVNATQGFNTSDGYQYLPTAVEIHTSVEMVTTEVHSIHFKNQTIATSENVAIKDLWKARKELREANAKLYLLSFHGGGGISYLEVTLVSLGLGLFSRLIIYVFRRVRNTDKRRHHEVRRLVTNSVYGSKIYETLNHRTNSPKGTTVINLLPQTTAPYRSFRGLNKGDVM